MHHLLRRQHGVVTRDQLRGVGYTNHQVDGLLRRGDLVPVHRGVFRHAAAPSTWRSRVAAAVLGSGGVASHRCAAALWGLEVIRRPAVELTVAASRRSPQLAAVIVHRSTQWDRRAPTERHGIATTGIDRTLLDCAAVVGHDVLERLCESAIRQNLTSWRRLGETLATHAAPGRNGTAAMRELVDRRCGSVVPRSDFSRLVVGLLERHGVAVPALEYPIHTDDGRLLLLADLAWPRQRRVVELDGLEHHFGRIERERDIARRAEVRAAGWRVLELGWRQYSASPDHVVDLVRRFLEVPAEFAPDPAAF